MKQLVYVAFFTLLLAAAVPIPTAVHAQGGPQVQVSSQFVLSRYGYAVVNETVSFTNSGNGSVSVPTVAVGLGDLASKVVSYNLTGSGFKPGQLAGDAYTVIGGQRLSTGSTATFVLKALLPNLASPANGSLAVEVLIRPSVNTTVGTLKESVDLPASTLFTSVPTGLTASSKGNITDYVATVNNPALVTALTQLKEVKQATAQDFHPLVVFKAERIISASGVNPIVTDEVTFENTGTTPLTWLYLTPLTAYNSKVVIMPPPVPHLLNPAKAVLNGMGGIDLATSSAVGTSVSPDTNFTIVYQYPLGTKYYHTSDGDIVLTLPSSAPIAAFVNSYDVAFSLPADYKIVQAPPLPSSVVPVQWEVHKFTISYSLSVGWAVQEGIPVASAVFVLLLVGLFVSRTTMTEEEETEEESSTERASAMIKAFDDKTSMINGIWPEVSSADPNELNKAFFDEIRGRMDAFRSRALQRLNEVKQKSTTQKFFDLLNQIHTTEREVDRSSKDKLNLYEQYYTRRMRKEVFDRLLPQYSKRLEKALNELSDELHVVQREAKLL